MKAPEALSACLQQIPGMESGSKRLVLLFTQLGDFDSMEYAQALVPVLSRLEHQKIKTLAIAIGDQAGADRFCAFTGFPRSQLRVVPDANLHRSLGLSPGLQAAGGPWPSLLLMCAGIGTPGTLAEVLRGYTGDRNAPARFEDSPLFRLAGGSGFQRPFELATVRLRNMNEVLTKWGTYVPDNAYITQRGGTFLLDEDDSVLYVHRDQGILGFSETMNKPLTFLDPWLDSED